MSNILEQALEIVNACDNAEIQSRIKVAIATMGGPSYHVLEIKEESIDPYFPGGTRSFLVTYEHPNRDHMCTHVDIVYIYRERCIIIPPFDMRMMPRARLLHLLTSDGPTEPTGEI